MFRGSRRVAVSSVNSPVTAIRSPLSLSHCPRVRFSGTSRTSAYSDTIQNLKIGAHTRVIFQGFTGKQATQNARQSLEYGTKIVGGVRPGKHGEHLGLPVLPNMRAAKEQLKPDATAVYVAAHQAPAAIEEAIEAEIPLIVAVAEHIPVHDLLRIHSMLRTQSKSRLVGANAPGIISPIGRCRIGFQPLPTFSAGSVGIVAKSGTLSYETVASTSRAGVGQSLVIGMGGDVLAGTNFVDALKVFEHDDDTKGIIIVGEIGGRAEEEAAEWIKEYKRRTPNPKPIMALIGGVQAAPGRVMGHAGAFVAPGEGDALSKIRALEDAGVVITDHPAKFGEGMKKLLRSIGYMKSSAGAAAGQRRSMHTLRRRPRVQPRTFISQAQKRNLYINQSQAFDMLKDNNVSVSEKSAIPGKEYLLAVSIDRSNLCPCIVASPPTTAKDPYISARRFPFDYKAGLDDSLIPPIIEHLQLDPSSTKPLTRIIHSLLNLFITKEAFVLETRLSTTSQGNLAVSSARFGFDDAAFRSTQRQADVHALRNLQDEVPEEVEAEKDGIVYIKLKGEGSIGTLVNGAGLAMNTVDALTASGGHVANFLDTGGKATAATVASSFRLILSDPRVRTVFVNIFGGLTLCDMIAEGVVLAYRELGIRVPVVVRLRGTNEEGGQRMIAESGLPLHAFDDFEEAAAKVIELAGGNGGEAGDV